MSVGLINVHLELNNSQFTVNMAKSGSAAQQFSRQLGQSNRVAKDTGRNIQSLTGYMKNFFITVALARSAIANVWAVTGQWQQSIVETSAKLQRMQLLLQGLSKGATEQERVNDAQREFNEILNLSRTAPFAVDAITDSWVKLKSAGLDPANGSIRSLLDAVAKFGGTDESLHRASIAIQQMAGKGVISMEELRQQLGEAVPTAMKKLAIGMGMSMGELVKAISTGTVAAGPALEKLFNEFEMSFGGAAQDMMRSYSGQISLLKTNWMQLQDQIADGSGLLDYLTDQFRQLNAAMDPEITAGLARSLGESMRTVAQWTISAVQTIFKYREEIMATIKALGALFVTMRLWAAGVVVVGKVIAVWKTLKDVIIATQLAMQVTTVAQAFQAFNLALGPVLSGVLAFAVANPVGMFLALGAAVAGAVAYFGLIADKAKSAREDLEKAAKYGYIDEDEYKKQVKNNELNKESQEKLRNELSKQVQVLIDLQNQRFSSITALEKQRYEVQRLTAELVQASRAEEAFQEITKRREKAIKTSVEAEGRGEIEQNLARLREDLRRQDEMITNKYEDAGHKDAASRKALLDQRIAGIQEYAQKAEGVFNEILASFERRVAQENDPARKGIYAAELAEMKKLMEYERAKVEHEMAVLRRPVELVQAPGTGGGTSPIEERIASIIAQTKQLREELDGAGKGESLVEKYKALLNGGFFNDSKGNAPAQALRDELLRVAKALGEVQDATRKKKEADDALSNSTSTLNRWVEQSIEELDQWNDALDAGGTERADSRLRQFERTLASVRAQLNATGQSTEQFNGLIAQIESNLSESAGKKMLAELLRDSQDLNSQLVATARGRFEAERDLLRQQVDAQLAANNLIGTASGKAVHQQLNYLEALKEKLWELQSPLGQLMEKWGDYTENMKAATADFAESGLDYLSELAAGGKMSFEDLAKSIIKQLIKIALMKAFAGIAGQFTSPAPLPSTTVNMGDMGGGYFTNWAPQMLANGGVMTSKGLRKYKRGGIADEPQVAIYGEGSRPEAFVPLPDGRTIPVTLSGSISGGQEQRTPPAVSVNVINQTGNQVQAEQGSARFDGNQFVLDVVLKSVSRPGPFRDGLKSALR